jgi:hypothetical protein
MNVYLSKQQELVAIDTSTHCTVLLLVQKVEGLDNKLYVDNCSFSPALFDDLCKRKIVVVQSTTEVTCHSVLGQRT